MAYNAKGKLEEQRKKDVRVFINLKTDQELAGRLDKYCAASGATLTGAFRIAMDNFLKKQGY